MTPLTLHEQHIEHFFATAVERYQIKLLRESNKPGPWTDDPHFQTWRFCNVHREDDKTTVWFRENVRDHLDGLAALEAVVIFRWFNRIETGERIKDLLLEGWDTEEARRRLTGVSPVVTGAYIIKTYDAMTKLEGILKAIQGAMPRLAVMASDLNHTERPTLQSVWKELCEIDYLGGFMAYEIVSDLRWTPLLNRAPDIMTWANPGPGCARGLGWLSSAGATRDVRPSVNNRGQKAAMLEAMQCLLSFAQDDHFWPVEYRKWEMREVEHWCCEYDKMRRAMAGDPLKRRFQ